MIAAIDALEKEARRGNEEEPDQERIDGSMISQ